MNWNRVLFDIEIAGFFIYLIATGYLSQFLSLLGIQTNSNSNTKS